MIPEQTFVKLSDAWYWRNDPLPAVRLQNGEVVSRSAIFNAAYSLAPSLENKRIAIFCKSSLHQMTALLAALKFSSAIILPSTNSIEALLEIKGEFDLLLTDEKISADIPHVTIDKLDYSDTSNLEIEEVGRQTSPDILIYTSGSTGKPKCIRKNLHQFENEVQVWEDMMGAELSGTETLSTVSHQHIYGMLFRLLLPFCGGRIFLDQTASRWEEIEEMAPTDKPYIIVSSPAHLSRQEPFEDGNLNIKPLFVFSSGGVVLPDFAKQAVLNFGAPVLEIYGSTETGGIAKRFNTGMDEVWNPLPKTIVSSDDRGCLTLQSPFLPTLEELYSTEDLVAFHQDGTFTLGGRADRIVKVEGKRVSLPRLEELLRSHEWVRDTYTLLLSGDHPALSAIIELTEEGQSAISRMGNFRASRELRQFLAQFEDVVGVPKRWRFVDELPRNQQGKLRMSDARKLFEKLAQNQTEEGCKTFKLLSKKHSSNTLDLNLKPTADLEYFKGHFPGHPILPGVVQVHWVVEQTQKHFKIDRQPERIEKLKFKNFIFPEQEIHLNITAKSAGKYSFSYQSRRATGELVVHCSGVLNFGVAA